MDNWTCVYVTNSVAKAETVKGLLINEDIEAFVMNKQDSSFLLGEVMLYVQPEDENLAVELIKGFRVE